MSVLDNGLTYTEMDRTIGWFLHRMPMDQRHEFMADNPIVYAKLFPEVDQAIIIQAVARKINLLRGFPVV